MLVLIRFTIGLLKLLIKSLIIVTRYALTVSSLCVTIVTRNRIGTNIFGPWNNKSFGLAPHQYKAEFYTRFFVVALLYVWVRLFLLYCIYTDFLTTEDLLKTETYKILIHLFYSYDLMGDTSFFALPYKYTIPYLYSYYVVLLGLAHLFSFDILYLRKKALPPTHLGDSLIFGWLKKRLNIGDVFIWCVCEPLLMAVIGYALFVIGYTTYAWFFWIAGGSMSAQGYARYMKMKDEGYGFAESLAKGTVLGDRLPGDDGGIASQPPKPRGPAPLDF